MKTFRFLFILLLSAGIGLVVSSCGDDDQWDENNIGVVVFNGKRIALKAPIFENNDYQNSDQRVLYDRWKPVEGFSKEKEYCIGLTTHPGTTDNHSRETSFYFTTPMPQEDFEFDLTSFSTDYCFRTYFLSGGKYYVSSLEASVPIVSNTGLDPETYKADNPIYNTGNNTKYVRFSEVGSITGGYVRVNWGDETVKLEFDLRFDDGKTATGYGEIPREMIVL